MQCVEQIWVDRNNKIFSSFWSGTSWQDNKSIFCSIFSKISKVYHYANGSMIINNCIIAKLYFLNAFHHNDWLHISIVIVWWECVFLIAYLEMIFTPCNHFSNGTTLLSYHKNLKFIVFTLLDTQSGIKSNFWTFVIFILKSCHNF